MKIIIIVAGILLAIAPCYEASGGEAILVGAEQSNGSTYTQENLDEQEDATTGDRSDDKAGGKASRTGVPRPVAGAEHRLGTEPGQERSANGLWGLFRELAPLVGVAGFLLALANFVHTKATANESRADAALELFSTDPAVISILNPAPNRTAQFKDKETGDRAWDQYQRETIRPVLDRMERLATMTNPRRWRGGVFSVVLVERVASTAIQDIWADDYVDVVVKHDRAANGDPTVYIEAEALAERMERLKELRTTIGFARMLVRWLTWWESRCKLVAAGVI